MAMSKRWLAPEARIGWLIGNAVAMGCAGTSGSLPHGTEIPDSAGASAPPTAGRSGQAGAAGSGTGLSSVEPSAGRGGAGAAGTAAVGGSSRPPVAPHETYFVQDGALYDPCGEQLILRGINHPTLYIDRSGEALPEIAKTGANAVRLFWYAERGIAISEAQTAISTAIEQHMLPILEMHDSTCEWALDEIVRYWTSNEALALIKRYQHQLIINVANEPSAPDDSTFRSKYSAVIKTMRQAGIHVPLMIDGSNCGRDYMVLQSQGQALLDADPDHNLIFSAHLYDPLSASRLGSIFEDFNDAKLPFVVGEFANKEPPGCGAPLNYGDLIDQADKHGVGWLAWSWGDDDPNTAWNDDCAEFDMTSTFAFESLERWGKEVAVTHPASILHTAQRPHSMLSGSCQ